MKKLLYSLFALLLLAPVTGELWRINIWKLEFLPSDIAILTLVPLWVIDKVHSDRKVRLGKIGLTVFIFLMVITTTYLLNWFRFESPEMINGFMMLGRFAMYAVTAWIAYDLLDRDQKGEFRWWMLISMFSAMFLIVVLGFLQLKFFPSFLELGLYLDGWDPHIGRLLSTWFDPNFVGGFVAFVLSVCVSLTLYFYRKDDKARAYLLAALSLVSIIALYFTFSRSAYLALLAGLVILAFFKSRRLLLVGAIALALLFSFSGRMQERTLDMVDSAKSLIGVDSQKPLDPTARLRVYSWQFAWEIIQDYPIIGAGYGRYPYEINKRGHGLLSDHSSGGSDSSLLTIWASTGLAGLISFLAIGFVAAVLAIKQGWKKNGFQSYLAIGLLAGFSGMMVHSVFVNSLLYALMMTYLWPSIALLDEPQKNSSSPRKRSRYKDY
jgi:hypothetical protein